MCWRVCRVCHARAWTHTLHTGTVGATGLCLTRWRSDISVRWSPRVKGCLAAIHSAAQHQRVSQGSSPSPETCWEVPSGCFRSERQTILFFFLRIGWRTNFSISRSRKYFINVTPFLNFLLSKKYGSNEIDEGFPGGSVIKNPPAEQEMQRHRFHPWVGKIPWKRAVAIHSSILA